MLPPSFGPHWVARACEKSLTGRGASKPLTRMFICRRYSATCTTGGWQEGWTSGLGPAGTLHLYFPPHPPFRPLHHLPPD